MLFHLLPALAQVPPPPQQGTPIPQIAPSTPLPVSPGLTVPGSATLQNNAPATPRSVTAVSVEGATILSPQQIAAATEGVVGPHTPTSKIEAARLALLGIYRDGGYPLVTVSATLATDGKLRFIVTEGRIADVKLEGDIGPAGTKVLAFLNRLIKPGPVSAGELERALLLAQDVPGVSLQTVLRPSDSDPGALVLVARVQRRAISGYIAADNRAAPTTGPDQAIAVVGTNSLTSLGERVELSLFHTLLDSSQVFGQAAYEMPIGTSGLKVRLYVGAGDSKPTGTLATIGYEGKTIIGGGQLSYPLIYTRQEKLNLVGALDAVQSVIYESIGGTGPATKEDLRVVRLGGDYALQDLWLGDSRPAVNQLSVRVSHGLQGLGSSHTGSLSLGRLDSDITFTKFTFEYSRTQTLFSPWENASVSLMGLIAGQYTGDILPTTEEFYLGGARLTRGFYAGQVTGDKALTTSLELQLNTSVPVQMFGQPNNIDMQFYGFYDWGQTWQNRTLDTDKHLSSAGGGVRTMLTASTELDAEGAVRFTRAPDGSAATIKLLPAEIFYWRILQRF